VVIVLHAALAVSIKFLFFAKGSPLKKGGEEHHDDDKKEGGDDAVRLMRMLFRA
jgi:hypothetical protein